MNGMLSLVFSAIVATAAGEVSYGNAHQHADIQLRRDACAPPANLCTDPVVLGGNEMTLTYVCPQTTEAPSTVHVTVTATTTITVPDEGPVKTTASIGPIATPAQPGPHPAEPDTTTTTTIHSTSTQYKTITVTRKPTISSSIPVVSTAWTTSETESLETLISATSMFEVPTPNFPSFTLISPTSSSAVAALTDGFTFLPVPTHSRPASSFWTPSAHPPVRTSVPSSGFSMPSSANATHSSQSVDDYPSATISGPPHASHASTHIHSWHFPTPRQIREVEATASANASASAKPSDKPGAASQLGVSSAALLCAMVAVAYFA